MTIVAKMPRLIDHNHCNPTIAVIEDDMIQQALLLTSLKCAHYDVWGAESAEQYYRQAVVCPADIVIADVGLPGEDGLSLLKHLSQNKNIALICITGDKTDETELNAWRSGVHLFFSKPLDIGKLMLSIQMLSERIGRNQSASPQISNEWVLDTVRSSISSPCGACIQLSQSELCFLKILAKTPMEVVPNETILTIMYSDDFDGKHRLEMLINRLRQKFRKHDLVSPLRSVFGKGRVFSESVAFENMTNKNVSNFQDSM